MLECFCFCFWFQFAVYASHIKGLLNYKNCLINLYTSNWMIKNTNDNDEYSSSDSIKIEE